MKGSRSELLQSSKINTHARGKSVELYFQSGDKRTLSISPTHFLTGFLFPTCFKNTNFIPSATVLQIVPQTSSLAVLHFYLIPPEFMNLCTLLLQTKPDLLKDGEDCFV